MAAASGSGSNPNPGSGNPPLDVLPLPPPFPAFDDDDDDEPDDNDPALPEDPLPARVDSAYLGTVRMNCVLLDPDWGSGTQANRPLNTRNVDSLVTSFKTNIRRWAPGTRMKASCPISRWNQVLAFQQSQQNLTPPLQEQVRDARIKHLQDEISHITWRRRAVQASDVNGAPSEDVNHPDNTPRPTLESGQHRRAAIMRHLELEDDFEGWINNVCFFHLTMS